LGLPDYAHGYYSQNFSWAFVPIDRMNIPAKFEVPYDFDFDLFCTSDFDFDFKLLSDK